MKKILLLATALLLIGLTSCTKEYIYYPEYSTQTVLVNVGINDWAYSNVENNNYFYATVDMPEITSDILKTGLVKAYRVYNFEKSDETQIEMPYTRHYEYNISGDDWGFYTETIDYEIQKGLITFCYSVSDFEYEVDTTIKPEAMQFRIVVIR